MKKNMISAAGLALAIALSPVAAHAVEVLKTEDVSIDVGARLQLLGTFQNFTSTEFAPGAGNGNRDETQIYLFQHQNRLKLGANVEGVKFYMEEALGNEAFLNNSNNYSYNVMEMNAEIALGESSALVAGVFRRPESVRDASYDENLLFTGESQLANLFFNSGSDVGLYAKTQMGSVDALFGVVQGTANLPQRYIPERLSFPVPVIARIGIGNITDDPSHPLQQGFAKVDDLKWRLGAGAYWVADSNAGHSSLFGQLAGQAENTKGPFNQGNLIFSKTYYNPFMAAGAYTNSSLDRLDNQFYSLNLNGQFRAPMGDNTLVAGAEWDFEQFIAKGMYYANGGKGVKVNGQYYNYGQLTVQGGEAYLAYVAPKWWAASRLDVLVPDALLGARDATTGNVASAWGNQTQWELTLPVLGYRINKYTTLTAELEHNLNSTLAVDSDGVYSLKTVPTESAANALSYMAYQMTGRMQLQIAF